MKYSSFATEALARSEAETVRIHIIQDVVGLASIPEVLQDINQWEIHVWDNLGWHYRLTNHGLILRRFIDRKGKTYATAWAVGLSRGVYELGTEVRFSVIPNYPTARAAILAQVERLRHCIREDMALLEGLTGTRDLDKRMTDREWAEARGLPVPPLPPPATAGCLCSCQHRKAVHDPVTGRCMKIFCHCEKFEDSPTRVFRAAKQAKAKAKTREVPGGK